MARLDEDLLFIERVQQATPQQRLRGRLLKKALRDVVSACASVERIACGWLVDILRSKGEISGVFQRSKNAK
jgi:hypothetical protein